MNLETQCYINFNIIIIIIMELIDNSCIPALQTSGVELLLSFIVVYSVMSS